MKVEVYGATDAGKVRSRNEDAFLVNRENRIYAVADGLGGLPQGDLASRLAVEEITTSMRNGVSALDVEKLIKASNGVVWREGRAIDSEFGIGTTLTLVALNGRRGMLGHVGDGAVYLLRKGHFSQLTQEHTMEADLRAKMEPGEKATFPEYFAHTLTRCLGQAESVEPDLSTLELEPADRLVICSDGISKTLDSKDITKRMRKAKTPQDLVDSLIKRANDLGGPDNATAVAVFVLGES